MVLDTSALLAILFGEPESEAMVRAIARDERRLVGSPTLVEASAVMRARKGGAGEVALDGLLERLSVVIVPMSVGAARLARLAYARFAPCSRSSTRRECPSPGRARRPGEGRSLTGG